MTNPLKAMTPKKRQKLVYQSTRTVIQITCFLLAPSLFTEAFGGVKSIFRAISAGQMLEFNSFVRTLVILCGVTILTGRFFCGYMCAFGSLGDWVYALSRKIQKTISRRKSKNVQLPKIPLRWQKRQQWIKYGVLAVIVLLCALGVYDSLRGWSPWDVFSMVRARNLKLAGYTTGIILLVLIVLGMAWKERFFCQFLCPMGAVFALLPQLPFSALQRDEANCIKGCQACKNNCPVDLKLEKDGFRGGECIACEKCAGICPKGNLTRWDRKLLKHEAVPVILKAALLLGLGFWLGLVRIW